MYKLILLFSLLFFRANANDLSSNRENKLKNNIHHNSGDLYLFKIANSTDFQKGYIELKIASKEINGDKVAIIHANFKFIADGRRLYLPKLDVNFVAVIKDEKYRSTKMDPLTKKMMNHYTFDEYLKFSASILKTSRTVDDKAKIEIIWPQKLENYFFKGFMELETRIVVDGYDLEIKDIERWEVRAYDSYLMIGSLFTFILSVLLNFISRFYEESRHLMIPMASFPIIVTVLILRFNLPKLLYLPVAYHVIMLIPFFKERKEENKSSNKQILSKNEKSSFRILVILSLLLILLSFEYQIGALIGCIYLIQLTFTYEFCLVEKRDQFDDRINQIFIFWFFFQLSSYMNHILFGFFIFSYGFLEPYRNDLLWVYLLPCLFLNVIGILKKVYPKQVSYFAEKLSVVINRILKWCNRGNSQEAF